MIPPAGSSCPDIDRLVDAVADGQPGAVERLDAHAASCAACAAEAALADDDDGLGDLLACLDGTDCPPEIVASALAAARETPTRRASAPDRQAAGVAPRTRRQVWRVAAAAAVLAAVAAAAFLASPDVPAGPPVAETLRPAGQTRGPSVEPSPEPTPEPRRLADAPPRPLLASRAPTPRRAPVQPPAAPTAPVPTSVPVTPDPTEAALPEAVLPEALVAAATPADSLAARESLALALGIVARAQRAADDAVTDELRRVSTALAPARLL